MIMHKYLLQDANLVKIIDSKTTVQTENRRKLGTDADIEMQTSKYRCPGCNISRYHSMKIAIVTSS
jgi:hypothetical protein